MSQASRVLGIALLAVVTGLGIFLAGCEGSNLSAPTRFTKFQVTVENLTPTVSFDASGTNTPPKAPTFRPKGDMSSQPFTQPIFATHDGAYSMWHVGSAATPALQQIAEDGFNKKPGNFADPGYMLGSLQQQQGTGHVLNVIEVPNPAFNTASQFANSSGDVAAPATVPFPLTNWVPSGGRVTFTITDDAAHHLLSGAFMLIRTNDAFTGVDSVDLDTIKQGGQVFDLVAYDSGTEKNTEAHDDLVYFDSPPSGHIAEDVNTSIHKHTGIVGAGGSALAPYAWNNSQPVARVTIKPIP